MENKKELSPEQREELLRALKARFEENMNRHKGLEWAKVQAKLVANNEKLWSLNEMERTGGEPDVVGNDKKTGEYLFFPFLYLLLQFYSQCFRQFRSSMELCRSVLEK